MEDALGFVQNRVNLIQKIDKFLNFLSELDTNGTLRYFYDELTPLRVKMAVFNIPLNFNYDLWRRLQDCNVYFN